MRSSFFLKSVWIILLPFSFVYWLVVWIRNWMYDKNILSSAEFAMPLICVGNLSVGGTGKSPMVEYLVGMLKREFRVATLSRGYKRKTKGYALADESSTALDIGDEPMQFHLKFRDVPVAVGEERIVAIPQLLHDRPDTQVIIMDDAFQHREVIAGLNILLTDFNNLFTRDLYLPAGELRDLRSSYKRAQLIVVTKCPADLTPEKSAKIVREIKPLPHQSVFFTTLKYGSFYHIYEGAEIIIDESFEVLLISGIANPEPLKSMLEDVCGSYEFLQYNDHHIYTIDDLKEIKKAFGKMDAARKIMLTTEKDAVRLMKFREEITTLPLYVVPVEHHFLMDQEGDFKDKVKSFINSFRNPEE